MENEKIKIILVGESKVGKTSIIKQYCEKMFSEEYISTIGSDKILKEIELENKTKVNLEIWDTVGQERYSSTNKIFFKKTQIAILVYDITERKTFEKLQKWYDQIKEINNTEDIIIGVVGNKSDLYENVDVNKEEGTKFANDINGKFFETTAREYECIENVFITLTKEYYKTIKNKKLNSNPKTEINQNPNNEKNEVTNQSSNINPSESSHVNKDDDVIDLNKPKIIQKKKCFGLCSD